MAAEAIRWQGERVVCGGKMSSRKWEATRVTAKGPDKRSLVGLSEKPLGGCVHIRMVSN